MVVKKLEYLPTVKGSLGNSQIISPVLDKASDKNDDDRRGTRTIQ
jgi:hypothetical protein